MTGIFDVTFNWSTIHQSSLDDVIEQYGKIIYGNYAFNHYLKEIKTNDDKKEVALTNILNYVNKTKNEVVAKWFIKELTSKDDKTYQNVLGLCYSNGIGVEKNMVEAINYYSLSSEQGDSYAQYTLGMFYINGCGVEQSATQLPLNEHKCSFLDKDMTKALHLLKSSYEQGNVLSCGILDLIYTKMLKDINNNFTDYQIMYDAMIHKGEEEKYYEIIKEKVVLATDIITMYLGRYNINHCSIIIINYLYQI